MTSIIINEITPLIAGGVMGLAAYKASRIGSGKSKTATERSMQHKKALKQGTTIGAGAATAGALTKAYERWRKTREGVMKEIIDPLTQAAIWGGASYLASKAGSNKAKSTITQKKQNVRNLKQGLIGAGAGALGSIGVSGLKKGYEALKSSVER